MTYCILQKAGGLRSGSDSPGNVWHAVRSDARARQGGVVLMANVPASSIISSPRAAEFVVDPRGLRISSYQPADVAREVLKHGS
jgi:hypothetical protein